MKQKNKDSKKRAACDALPSLASTCSQDEGAAVKSSSTGAHGPRTLAASVSGFAASDDSGIGAADGQGDSPSSNAAPRCRSQMGSKLCPACSQVNLLSHLSCILCGAKFSAERHVERRLVRQCHSLCSSRWHVSHIPSSMSPLACRRWRTHPICSCNGGAATTAIRSSCATLSSRA